MIMVRSFPEEIKHRTKLRKKYFEDPSYRKWSDVVDNCVLDTSYGGFRDDLLFDFFITNQVRQASGILTLRRYLDNGHKLPINWNNFYAYFDEQVNDPENPLAREISGRRFPNTLRTRASSVKELLDEYRDKLIADYDIV